MLSTIDSIILGTVQGLTEFLPISSSGHLIIARELLGLQQTGGLAFDAVLQLATACAVVLYFRKDIFELVSNLFKKVKDPIKTKLTCALIIGTIPAIILGLFLQDYMETIFRSPLLVALTLIVGAGIMFAADKFLVRHIQDKGPDSRLRGNDEAGGITLKKSFIIGLFQSLALVPGMSRSGMSISGGYFLGLSKDMAVRFSFLLSIPIIVGSGLIKVKDIVQDTSLIGGEVSVLVWGALASFIFGWLAIDFLLKFLKMNSFKGFVVYRVVLAILILSFFI